MRRSLPDSTHGKLDSSALATQEAREVKKNVANHFGKWSPTELRLVVVNSVWLICVDFMRWASASTSSASLDCSDFKL